MSSSTIPDRPPASAPQPQPLGHELASARDRLRQQRARARQGIWVETVGLVALMLIAYAVPTLLTDRWLRLEWGFRALLLLSFGLFVVRAVWQRLVQPLEVTLTDEEIALAVERKSPELEQVLISSLQFDRELGASSKSIESAAMKGAVVASVRDRLQSIPFARAIDASRVRKFAMGILAMLVFFGGWAGLDAQSLGTWASRNLLLTNTDWPRYTTITFVDGAREVRLPQGDPLTVRVLVDGPEIDQVFLDYEFVDGDSGSEPMSRTGEDEYTWTLDSVLTDVKLRVQGGDSLPAELDVVVVERPLVEDLAIRVALPEYMEREPYDVPPTEGELRLPKGSQLAISGKSQKPLASAFLLFGNDAKVDLPLGEDGQSFAGAFFPKESGLMIIDVIDADSLGAGTPPKIVLRVGADKAPTIDIRLRGIGSSITSQARIPGLLKVTDDFGLRSMRGVIRGVTDQPKDQEADADKPALEEPWVDADPLYSVGLVKNALRYEAEASVDLTDWNKDTNQMSSANPYRPGMLFSLRYSAEDNFGPGEPHVGYTETMTFRIVTRDKLVEELRRRQVEQRVVLQQIADEEAAGTLEVGETVNPNDAGDQSRLVKARYKAMARRQQALGRRVRFVSEAYQRILWEYENNRLIEANKVRQMEAVITVPLAVLAKEAFPATARLVTQFQETGDESVRASAVEGYRDIMARLAAVLNEMEQAENLAALLEELRNVINLEAEAIRDVRKRIKELEDDLFNRKKK